MKRVLGLALCLMGISAGCAREEPPNAMLRRVALRYAAAEYGHAPDAVQLVEQATKPALVLTLTGKTSHGILRYLLIPEVAGGVVPGKKECRTIVLNTVGPRSGEWHEGCIRHLTEEEYGALSAIASRTESPVEDDRVREILRTKVLPEQLRSLGNGEEWGGAELTQRATTVEACRFEFKIKPKPGPNVVGVAVYVDANGEILGRWEAMLHAD